MGTPTIWFTSDLHLFHEKVAQLRGFDTIREWHQHLDDRWKRVVKPADQVWVLGDLAGGGHLDEALSFMAGLPGEKHLILGNHDSGHPMHRDSHRKIGRYSGIFASAQLAARRRIAGRSVLLSHFPYEGDTPSTTEDRHTQWRLRNQGDPLLHGHTHSSLVRLNPDNIIHVGWDAWHRLVPLDDIADLLV